MKKIVKLTESDLNRIVNKVLKEQEVADYMFFSNLQQIKRQCEILLEMNPQQIDEIINEGGHDWADDHVTEAKNNMDQVFDFFMNETKSEDGVEINANVDSFSMNEEYQIDESENCPTSPSKWASSKVAAKAKYDVYPSALANGWALQNYKKKGGGWKKCKK